MDRRDCSPNFTIGDDELTDASYRILRCIVFFNVIHRRMQFLFQSFWWTIQVV